VKPSGRLVYTIAKNLKDYAQPDIVTDPQPYPQVNYTEGVSVDYRGFEKNGIKPRFAFGHGLSYSAFTYTSLEVSKHGGLAAALETPIEYVGNAPGGDMALYDVAIIAEVTIRNEGPYDGTEISQLLSRNAQASGKFNQGPPGLCLYPHPRWRNSNPQDLPYPEGYQLLEGYEADMGYP
jgi:beta-glucosidase